MGGSFEPAHDAHAIERVVATITLKTPIDTNDWPNVNEALRACAMRVGLPRYLDEIEVAPANIEGDTPKVPALQLHLLHSPRFVQVSDDGAEIGSIGANRTQIQVQTRRYIRWIGFEEVLHEVTRSVASAFPEAARIGSLRLDYADRFVQAGADQPAPGWDKVLAAGDLISASHFGRSSPWHMFTGWFEDYTDIGRAPPRTHSIRSSLSELTTRSGT